MCCRGTPVKNKISLSNSKTFCVWQCQWKSIGQYIAKMLSEQAFSSQRCKTKLGKQIFLFINIKMQNDNFIEKNNFKYIHLNFWQRQKPITSAKYCSGRDQTFQWNAGQFGRFLSSESYWNHHVFKTKPTDFSFLFYSATGTMAADILIT